MYMGAGNSFSPFASGTLAAGSIATADTSSMILLVAHLVVAFFALAALAMGMTKLLPARRRRSAATAHQVPPNRRPAAAYGTC